MSVDDREWWIFKGSSGGERIENKQFGSIESDPHIRLSIWKPAPSRFTLIGMRTSNDDGMRRVVLVMENVSRPGNSIGFNSG